MSALDFAALVVIFVMIILFTVVIVALGSLPGNIAKKRGHPYPDAVNAASWIGLATGVFWPVAFIWAFLTRPEEAPKVSRPLETQADNAELAEMRQRVEALEQATAKIQSRNTGDS